MSSKPFKSADDIRRERQEARKAEIDSAFDIIADGQIATNALLVGLLEGFCSLCNRLGDEAANEAWNMVLFGPGQLPRAIPKNARVSTTGLYVEFTRYRSPYLPADELAKFHSRQLALAELTAWCEKRIREMSQKRLAEAEKKVAKALGLKEAELQ